MRIRFDYSRVRQNSFKSDVMVESDLHAAANYELNQWMNFIVSKGDISQILDQLGYMAL